MLRERSGDEDILKGGTSYSLSAVLLIAFLGAAPSVADPGEHTHKVFGANTYPYDLGYSRWLGRWAKWIQELPDRDFPSPSSTSNCDVHGPAVFMGPFGAEGCTIPEGKAVAFQPYLQWECSTAEGFGKSYRELRMCAVQKFARDFGRDKVSVHVRVDGKRLEQPRRWTVTSHGRVVDLPKNTHLGHATWSYQVHHAWAVLPAQASCSG